MKHLMGTNNILYTEFGLYKQRGKRGAGIVEIKKEDIKKMLVWDNDEDPKVEMYVLAAIGKNYICSSSLDYIDKVWVAYQNAEPLKGETNGT